MAFPPPHTGTSTPSPFRPTSRQAGCSETALGKQFEVNPEGPRPHLKVWRKRGSGGTPELEEQRQLRVRSVQLHRDLVRGGGGGEGQREQRRERKKQKVSGWALGGGQSTQSLPKAQANSRCQKPPSVMLLGPASYSACVTWKLEK